MRERWKPPRAITATAINACPAGMVFVPSVNGISHNVREFTAREDLEAGANVLLKVLVELVMEG